LALTLAFLGYSGRTRLGAALRELEIAQNNLGAVHALIACAWLFSFGIGRAPEGILFGALIGISLLRIPRTAALLAEALKACGPVLACMGLLLLIGISAAWSPIEANADWYPPRHILYPVLLAPLLGRWRLLVWSYLLGLVFQASWILIEYVLVNDYQYGYPLGSSSNVHFWGGPMAVGSILAACLLFDASGGRGPRVAALLSWLVCMSAAFVIAGRTTSIAMLAGLLTAGAWTAVRARLSWKAPAIALACTVLCWLAFGTTLTSRFQQKMGDSSTTSLRTRLHEFTSARTWMWETTLPSWQAHPIAGWGRDAWAVVFRERIQALPKEELLRPVGQLQHLNTAHNTYIQALVDQGAMGLTLVMLSLTALAVHSWRSTSINGSMLAGICSYWAISGCMLSELNTSHGLVPFGIMMILALGITVDAPRSQFDP
jgi:O-antigen ligase